MIPDIKELNFPKKEGKQYATLSHATVSHVDMGEKNITTQVKIDGAIAPDFSYDWAVEFQGEKYIMPLRKPQGSKGNESLDSEIDLTFRHWAIWQLKRWPFVTIQSIQTGSYIADEEVADVILNLGDFCELLGQVLEYYYGDAITIDLNPSWKYDKEATAISINHSTIWKVLTEVLYPKYGVRWEIGVSEDAWQGQNNGEKYVIRVGYDATEADHIFEYGFEGGLLKVERQVQSEDIHNMIKGRGGEKNIPLRYFKSADADNKDFEADPDWVEELADIYFTNLMPATFRSYVQGWKAAHISKYPGYTAKGEANAYSSWAYRKGATDTKFHPVEFVADEITVSPTANDRRVEILPGYSPYVKKGSSLDEYGPLQTTLNNDDDIYPTLQGTGLDVAVDVEQIESDDVKGSAENDAQMEDTTYAEIIKKNVAPGHATASDGSKRTYFTVASGKVANIEGHAGVKAYNPKDHKNMSDLIAELEHTIRVFNANTGVERSASGIPAGEWCFTVEYSFNNTSQERLNVTCTLNSVKISSATPGEKWRNTFDIWVKNIWGSNKGASETDDHYAERVWKPRLGDRERNTAKVVFTSGMLAHEDYEFTIVDFPSYDTSRSLGGVQSHWRIRLAKSEAELEATGLYIPSTKKQGKAGDTFVFIGTEMTHVPYVTDAEIRVDEKKKDVLREKKEIRPTAVVATDRVRLSNEGKADALIGKLRAGNMLRLYDKRFFPAEEGKAYEALYLQSITYTYREPSSDDAALNPDVEIVLGNEYAPGGDADAIIEGEISALQRQVGSISNVEQIVRAVGDRLYMRKDGIPDRSLSPTQFLSLLTSGDFRAGLIGGAGWGFYKDENGSWVLEVPRLNVRQDITVNTLVINQAEGRGGMDIDTAAFMEASRVEESADGYVCYFDQKEGTVANLFHVDDVAYCNRWTAENAELKFYKRRVTEVGADYIKLTKALSESERPAGWPDSGVNGSGVPGDKDNIIHFGNYSDKTRQYVKVRDVVGGGYERFLDGLNSVNATGTEYYFVGRQAGMYNNRPRWYVGDENGYIEWVNGNLTIKGSLSIHSTIGNKPIGDYVNGAAQDAANAAKTELEKDIKALQDQVDGVIEAFNGFGAPTLSNYPANEWTTDEERKRHDKDIYTDITPYVDNATTPTSGQSWKWYYNSPTDYGWVKIADSDAVKALQLAQISVRDTDVLYISHTSRTSAPALPTVNASGVITSLNGWSTQSPQWQADKYIWQTTYVRRGDGSATFSDPTCVSGKDGADGTPGAPGADGRTPYTHWAYANSADGVTAFSTTYFAGALYMGTYTDYTQADSTAPADYVWMRIKGEDGKGIVSVNEFYAVNNDAANAPVDAAFVQSPMPQTSPTNRYLWNYEDTTYSDNSHTRTDKAIIGVHGSNGEDGASITAVTNYYLASAAATGVTVATAGWTADASATAATMTNAKPYLWNYEEITYSKGNPTRTAPHVVGRMGRGVSKIEEEYYLSTSQTQLSGGEWKSEADKPVWVPGKYMWTRTKVTYTDGTSEYTGVVCATGGTGTSVLAQYSADGVNWHPSYAANDIWMRTSSDGGTMWTPGMRIVGANYSPNLLKDKYTATQSHVSAIEHGVQIVPTDVDTYFSVHTDDGVNLADYIGKDITISLDCEGLAAGQKYVFFIGNKAANAIEVHNGHNVNTIKLAAGSTFGNGYMTFDDSVRPAATSTPVKITRACITSGANPAQQWVPAASEMEGTEGKWRKFQWAKNTSTTSEPTSGWQDTPMTAPSGEYVWMRSGLVVPPATNPAKWDAAVRITGDSGKDGSDVYLLDLSNEVAGIACDALGAVTGSYPTVTAKVHKGSQPASGVSFSIPTKTGITTATITSAGVVTMSGMTADTAEITVQAVVGGVTLQSTISLYKVKPGVAGKDGENGLSYAVNLLKKSNVVQQTVGRVLGSYEWDEHPAVGTDCTLTICGKVGPKDNYIELYQNKGYHKIGNFEGRTETVKSFKFKVTEVAGRTTLVDFYRNPDDGDFDSGTYIKWAVITLGDAPQTCWTPAKSEMEGARVFSLQPSTDSVSRNAMGVLSATKVSATKYVTTGDGMATTTEHYLYYRRDSESGTSAWTLGAGVGSPTTPQIDILEDTRSVVFELRDSSGMVLDRERVPVISDAADMKVGGTNLLRNSDFIDGLKYWDNNFLASLNAVTIPERSAAIGWFDNRLSAKVSHLENSQTWRKLLQPIEKGRIVPGKTYTLSGFVYIPDKSAMGAAANGSTAYRLRATMCYKLKNDTSNHDNSVIDLMQAPEGEWSYMSGRWTAPANLNTEEKVEMAFYLVANGEYYVNGWKLEEGNVPTAWNAAPEDTSYLRSALRENVELNGGLVAATLLNLGITEENGTFRTTAGMNGSTEVRGDRSIAFWAGGDAIDAEKPGNGTPAKIVMRHDGTAYFCDNIIRFDENRVEIGKKGSNKLVVLDEDGLKLIDGNEQRLRVVNQSVGTLASVVQSTGVTLNATNGIRVRRTRNKDVTTISNSGTTRVVGSFTKNFNIGSGNLPVGATVNITGSIYSEFPLINDDLEGFPLLGANARLQIYERQSGTIIFDKKAPLGYDGDKWKDHWAKISANVTIPKAGEYRGNLMLEGDGTEGPANEMTVATATAKVEGSVQLGFSDQTVLGNDGLLSKWGETAWLVRSGEVHAKVGTTEFQILPNGIKAIINGKTTWLAQ